MKNIELSNKIISDCHSSSEIRQGMLTNPKETLKEHYNVDMSRYTKVVVEEQDVSSHIYINIPNKESIENIELSDSELESIAGGWAWVPFAVGASLIYSFVDGFIDGYNGN